MVNQLLSRNSLSSCLAVFAGARDLDHLESGHADDDLTGFYAQTVDYYESCADVYDELYPDHLGYSRRLFQALLPVFLKYRVRSVLDACCGVGHDISCLSDYGFSVTGVDVSHSMVVEARKRLERKGLRVELIQEGDVRQLDTLVAPKSYDLVLFRGNAFSNISYCDVPRVITQLVRAVCPGGVLLVDYRNGHRLFEEKRSFEFRGFGYNSASRAAYFSFYVVDHSDRIKAPYRVNATVLRWKRASPTKHHLHIRSHYVMPEQILSVLRVNNCELLGPPQFHNGGLPCLENVIAVKPLG